MATRAAETPAGKISEVFRKDRERQGAYDLLESGKVSVVALLSAMGDATGFRAAAEPFAYVAIDGASITLTDREQTKDFGRVGNLDSLRGLKVINALGIDPRGVPLGLFTQEWWTRPPVPVRTGSKKQRRAQKKKSKQQRGPGEKETRYWLQAIEKSTAHAQKTGAKLWFLLDREADCQAILMKLTESNHQFTVRGSWNRVIEDADEDGQHLLEWLGKKAPQGAYEMDVPAGPQRTARRARIAVRWGKVVLRLRKDRDVPEQLLEINAVWAQEHRTCPEGEKPLDWLLLTSAEVSSLEDAREVIFGYTLRWRIESFHKTWKTGACSEPDKPASIELDAYEIRALIVLKRAIKKKTETIPDTMPTIRHATLWIAELGGYTGGYTGRTTGGPPGAITIRRGLDYLRPAAELLRRLEVEK
jgi:hypothetical protein